MRVLITRPRPEGERLAQVLRERGFEARVEPMLKISHRAVAPPAVERLQAIVLTSANGARALAAASPLRDPPVYAVGEHTAAAAVEAGFERVRLGGGDVAALAASVTRELDPGAGPLLYAAGAERAGDLAGVLGDAGFEIVSVVLYDADAAQALSPGCVLALRGAKIDVVLFFSPRSAAAFVSLARDAGVEGNCAAVAALCLSDAVAAAAAPMRWRRVRIAARPDAPSLLALLDELADERRG